MTRFRAVVLFAAVGFGMRSAIEVSARVLSVLPLFLAAVFISFALDPVVAALHRRGLERHRATQLVFIGTTGLVAGFVYGIFSILGAQTGKLVARWPTILRSVNDDTQRWFGLHLDPGTLLTSDIVAAHLNEALTKTGQVLWSTVSGVSAVVAIVVVAYFFAADGPAIRRGVCSWLRPEHQQHVLRVWEKAIERTSRYIYSRFLLGVASAIGHTIAFAIIGVPYPLVLGMWVGVASQTVPLVGTYLAGLLPALVALADSPTRAVAVVVLVTVFQQIENHTLGPLLSRRTVEVHPAVAFGAVIAGTSLLGPVGAVLAVPTVAIVTSLFGEPRG